MKRILFVDDESKILDGIRRMLYADRNRWDMHFAVGGAAALQAFEAGGFDVVISDMRMPEMDGIALLKQVRDRFPDTARLILSGFSEPDLATQAVSIAHQVLSKPCRGEELHAAIERVCALQDVLCAPKLRQVVGMIGALPTLSRTYEVLAKALDDPLTSIERVAGIIEQDIAMSAKVLQLVNSGFFGLAQEVVAIEKAVAYLGMDTIKNLVLTSDIFTVFTPNSQFQESFYRRLQQHAIRTAAIVNTLQVMPKKRGVAVISALLHDIGTLILASNMPDQFRSVLSYMKEHGCRQFEAEGVLIGTSHAEIGAYLLGLWGLNSIVVESIAYHHDPICSLHPGLDSSAAVYIADLLDHHLTDYPAGPQPEKLREEERSCLTSLGLFEQFPALYEQARQCLVSNCAASL